MRNICYFINSDWYFDLHWFDRAKGTQAEGFDVHIISDFKNEDIKKKLEENGFHCYKSKLNPQSLNPFSFFISSIYLFRLLKKIDADIIHCITIKPCLIGGLFARSNFKKVVISFVGLGRIFSSQKKAYRLIQTLVLPVYRYIFSNPRVALLFEHENDRQYLVNLIRIPLEKTIVIDGAGIDTCLFDFKNEPDQDIPTVLFASRLLKSKGLQDLIHVKEILSDEGVEFKLDVAGIIVKDDSDAVDIKLIEKWHQNKIINWLGQRNDINQLISQSSIVALPSLYPEGVPRILIEGASIGRALIAYDSGGCSSIVQDHVNGFLIPRGDLVDLKNKLKLLITDKTLREKMGVKSRELVLKKFSSSIVLYKTLVVYQSL
ncbi:glycosyltransferase family 4 protein [Pantoea agglomerans]|uniref:glycosyltransferase family 4 protein n=1 Tax=Enterobacter agglomerans TaxID=549 RepID=UPI00177CC635|nr:glycosyltransferase family 4 protein [Pantoea agglomerans]WVL91127.1 glycosyltransferase family 4 protein [Pantoea agglomerans]